MFNFLVYFNMAKFSYNMWHAVIKAGNGKLDEAKEDRMDDWKLQQGNLGHEPDEDPDAAMYVYSTTIRKL